MRGPHATPRPGFRGHEAVLLASVPVGLASAFAGFLLPGLFLPLLAALLLMPHARRRGLAPTDLLLGAAIAQGVLFVAWMITIVVLVVLVGPGDLRAF